MNVFGPRGQSSRVPQEGGHYTFDFGERKGLYGVFRSKPQGRFNVLVLEPVAQEEDENLVALQGPVLLNLPELRPTGEVLQIQPIINRIVLLKQIYITFTSNFVANIIRFYDGMQGVYHIDDDYIPQLRELASDNPKRMEWEISFGGFFNHFFSVHIAAQGRADVKTDGSLVSYINSEHEYHMFKIKMHEVSILLS